MFVFFSTLFFLHSIFSYQQPKRLAFVLSLPGSMLISRASVTTLKNIPPIANLFCRFPRSLRSTSNAKNTNMKLRKSTIPAIAMVSCLGPHPSEAWAPRLLFPSLLRQYRNLSSGSTLQLASIMSEGEATLPIGNPIATEPTLAKGTIASFFNGGLTAVQIDQDSLTEAVSSISSDKRVLSPADLPVEEKFKSDLGGDLTGHKVVFPDGHKGVVVAHRPPIAFVYNGVETMGLQDGQVSVLKEMARISVRDEKNVVRWDGSPVDDTATDNAVDMFRISSGRPIFAPIPQVKDIALINNPMLTGNTMIDTLAPIGQGQNMLLIADDVSAARGMICDFISTQQRRISGEHEKTKFVYAAIDDSVDVTKRLKDAGLLEKIHLVRSSLAEEDKVEEAARAAEATAMAATACAIAETYTIEQGMNTVVIIDSLDQHKKFWDATTRVLVDIFGMESVVKSDREGGASSEMRGFFSSIVQRSAQYKASRGGGSLTLLLLMHLPSASGDEDTTFSEKDFEGGSEKVRARIELLTKKGIPLTAATLRKIDIPIPSASEGQRRLVLQHIDDLISMSDGQIWLDETLREAGQNPPIDPQRSITRIGIGADTQSRADAPALRRIAEGLRLDLSQAANMDGAEVTSSSKKQIRRRSALLLAMHQEVGRGGRTLSESCTALLAASSGYLDNAVDSGKLAGTESGQELLDSLLEHVQKHAPDALATIDQTLDLSEEIKRELMNSIKSFF